MLVDRYFSENPNAMKGKPTHISVQTRFLMATLFQTFCVGAKCLNPHMSFFQNPELIKANIMGITSVTNTFLEQEATREKKAITIYLTFTSKLYYFRVTRSF